MPWGNQVNLLPYPDIRMLDVPSADDLRTRKRFKAIDWVSEPIFKAVVSGRTPSDALDDQDRPITIQGGKIWLTSGEHDSLQGHVARDPENNSEQTHVLWRTSNRPRVTVDRLTTASSVYAIGATRFNNHGDHRAGLYCIIEWLEDEPDLREQMQTYLEGTWPGRHRRRTQPGLWPIRSGVGGSGLLGHRG